MKNAFGLSIPERLEDTCTPSRCALVIYDMQVGIVPQISEGAKILVQCQQLLEAAREKQFRVFFTRHFFLPNHLAGVGQLHRSMIWQGLTDPSQVKPMMTQRSPAWQIVPELAPREDEVVIDKITMSAFESTFLNIAMRDAHLESFLIAGIALEVGIEPTVRHGLDLNYLPVVVTDACGSKADDLKQRSLATLTGTGEIKTFTTAEVVLAMKQ
ncbi:MAG TPA: isochorismatase family cysteine hydrolase [Acidobacteriaceae bacterium]